MSSKELQAAIDGAWDGVRNRDATGAQRREALGRILELRAEHGDAPLPTNYGYDAAMFKHQLERLSEGLPYGDNVVRPRQQAECAYGIGEYDGHDWRVRIVGDADPVLEKQPPAGGPWAEHLDTQVPESVNAYMVEHGYWGEESGDAPDFTSSSGQSAGSGEPSQTQQGDGGSSGQASDLGASDEERSDLSSETQFDPDGLSAEAEFDINAGYKALESRFPEAEFARIGYYGGKIYAAGRVAEGEVTLMVCPTALPLPEGSAFTWQPEPIEEGLPQPVKEALNGDSLFTRADDEESAGDSSTSDTSPSTTDGDREPSTDGDQDTNDEPTVDTQDHSPEGPNA